MTAVTPAVSRGLSPAQREADARFAQDWLRLSPEAEEVAKALGDGTQVVPYVMPDPGVFLKGLAGWFVYGGPHEQTASAMMLSLARALSLRTKERDQAQAEVEELRREVAQQLAGREGA